MSRPSPPVKTKQIMIRFTLEEYQQIRTAAYARGLDMGPMLADLVRPLIPGLPQKPADD